MVRLIKIEQPIERINSCKGCCLRQEKKIKKESCGFGKEKITGFEAEWE